MKHQTGSAMLATLFMIVVIGGMCAALQMTSLWTHRAATQSTEYRQAANTARSALRYYAHRLELDPNYFVTQTTHPPIPLGGASFQLTSVTAGTSPFEWQVDILSTSNGVQHRVLGVIAADVLEFPQGLVLGGTGDPSDDVLVMNGATRFGSYDPAVGTGTLNENASVWANGSISLMGTATIIGDASASGWISSVGPSTVTGTRTDLADEVPIDPYEDHAVELAAQSLASNANASLPAIFGAGWTPVAGPGNYGDLNLSGGNYTLGAGTYRFRDFTLGAGARLTLDTSTGPITIVAAGTSGVTVDSGSQVLIDAGGTTNGVVTVLESGSPFSVLNGSLFGREVDHPAAAGYSQLMSTGPGADLQSQGSSTVHARVAAPSRHLFVGGDSSWLGSAVVRSARFIGAAPKFFIDESLLGVTIGSTGHYAIEASWRGAIDP